MGKLLTIEDDLPLRETLVEILELYGHTVLQAGDGEEGVEIFSKTAPDLVLCDINMPKMNGIEFLEQRQKQTFLKLIPTVVLTTSKDEQNKMESYNLGVAGYMIKPVDYLKFVEVIKTINLYWTLSESVNINK